MKILSINAGSSFLKFSLFNMDDESVIASGVFERIGIEDSFYTIKFNSEKITQEIELPTHLEAVNVLLERLVTLGIIQSLYEIHGVGHRIVQGKDVFNESVVINNEVIAGLESIKKFAPLHNPANMLGIEAFRIALPDVIQVAVFDTAFHQTMTEEAYLYPVPYKWYEEYGVRKYGAHGISHRYIALQVKKLLGSSEYRLISCHIGAGVSVTAIRDGQCVDTSMGFTPLAGAMMGTRSGDIDSSIIPYVMEQEGKNAGEVLDDLNRKSGLLGLSEYSGDIEDILARCDEGDHRSIVAKDKYVQRIVDYIAQYYVLLGGVDVIVFTASVCKTICKEVCEKLGCLGIKIDDNFDSSSDDIKKISTGDSMADVYVIPTNEELMIARDTLNLINR